MSKNRKRRAVGTIDKLKPELKDTVDQMLLSGQTYREICQYLADNEVKLTQASVSCKAISSKCKRATNSTGKFQNDTH